MPLVLLLVLGAGALLVSRAHAARPSQTGLMRGAWYRLVLRSTLNRQTFGDAAAMQAQSLLGRQGFDVRSVQPDAVDPFVYRATGIYRGSADARTEGQLFDVPGILVLDRAEAPPQPDTLVTHIDDRPVAVQPGTTYFGRASISWPLSMLVTPARVRDKLTAEGFSNIQVFEDASALPADWPATERGGDLFVAATYSGPPKTMALPSQVVSVWTTGG